MCRMTAHIWRKAPMLIPPSDYEDVPIYRCQRCGGHLIRDHETIHNSFKNAFEDCDEAVVRRTLLE